jgi:hypothetical protein
LRWLADMGPSLRWGDGSGEDRMNNMVKIVLAIVILVVAWKIFKGVLGLLIGLAVVGLVIYGGARLIGGGTKRIK